MHKLLWFIVLLLPVLVSGQVAGDTVIRLEPVEIAASRLVQFSAGTRVDRLDSNYSGISGGFSLASAANSRSLVSVRTNGPAGISMMSIRGTQASHSGVFWNGFNLNAPNLGMTDLSILPGVLFDDVALHYGGASALYGSGVIGGGLHLQNRQAFHTPFTQSASLAAGSFGEYSGSLSLATGNDRMYYKGVCAGVSDRNNFPYEDLTGCEARLQHAGFREIAVIQQAGARLGKSSLLNAGIWWQSASRDLPATKVMSQSAQHQDDRALRASAEWIYTKARHSAQVRAAHFNEYQRYMDDVADIDAIYRLDRSAMEAEYRVRMKNFSVNTGGSLNYLVADVPYYKSLATRTEASFFHSWAYHASNGGFDANLNFRQDIIQGYTIPFCPSAGFNWKKGKRLLIRGMVSRNFRVPTMNDSYWIPGGNPDLKPESSWNQEAGFNYEFLRRPGISGSFEMTAYNLMIINLIQWVPTEYQIWSPRNVKNVWSRGLEISASSSVRAGKAMLTTHISFAYSPSTERDNDAVGGTGTGNQLIHMPRHKLGGLVKAVIGYYSLSTDGTLTGKRFTLSDNSTFLPAYFLMNIHAGKKFRIKDTEINLAMAVNNLLNADYEVVRYYPEQGRSFMVKLTITRTHKSTPL